MKSDPKSHRPPTGGAAGRPRRFVVASGANSKFVEDRFRDLLARYHAAGPARLAAGFHLHPARGQPTSRGGELHRATDQLGIGELDAGALAPGRTVSSPTAFRYMNS